MRVMVYDHLRKVSMPPAEYDAKFGAPRHKGITIIKDIEPYKSAMTGEVIGSRRRHRDHLREQGVEEVGNEKLPPRKSVDTKPEIARDLKESISRLQAGHRPDPVPTIDKITGD